MALSIKEYNDTLNNRMEFYILSLESWNDFTIIADFLETFKKARAIDKLDGIWSRYWTFELHNIEFKLTYHEDLGVYFYLTEQSKEKNKVLSETLLGMLPDLEN